MKTKIIYEYGVCGETRLPTLVLTFRNKKEQDSFVRKMKRIESCDFCEMEELKECGVDPADI